LSLKRGQRTSEAETDNVAFVGPSVLCLPRHVTEDHFSPPQLMDADAHAAAGGQQEIKMQKCSSAGIGPPLHWAKEDNILPSREKREENREIQKQQRLKTGKKAVLNRME
jgi:hypothetical protein